MKAFATALIASVAIMTGVAGASAQGACSNEYQSCMTSCASRPSKTTQDGCFNNCQANNNFCAERVLGKRPVGGAPSSVAEQKAQAKDAMAKKEQPSQDKTAGEAVSENKPQQPGPAPRR